MMEIISKTQVMEYNTPVLIGCIIFLIVYVVCAGLYLVHTDLSGPKADLIYGMISVVICVLVAFVIVSTKIPTGRYEYKVQVDDPVAFAEILKEYDNVNLKDGICTFEDRCK